jgi:hypothetical protein
MISTYPVCREYPFPATASQPEDNIQYKIQYKYSTNTIQNTSTIYNMSGRVVSDIQTRAEGETRML